MYYLWLFLLLFCFVNSCIQIFNAPSSLRCLALYRHPTCSFLRAAWWFYESACFRIAPLFSFFMNNSVDMMPFFFFFILQRWMLYSFLTTHQLCVFSCSFLNIWTFLACWPFLSIRLIYVIILALFAAFAHFLIGGRAQIPFVKVLSAQ